jgi:hypothetical protein
MLTEFLLRNEKEILALTEAKTRELAGDHPTSAQLKLGLPVFYRQIIDVINHAGSPVSPPPKDVGAIAQAADQNDEPAMAQAAGQPIEAGVARAAEAHGKHMEHLGFTLSHVVHAYGALCQSITEVATEQSARINTSEFHVLNRCLDVAIAGAVTGYQTQKEIERRTGAPALAEEFQDLVLRSKISFEAIRTGTVGIRGATADALAENLVRLEQLADRLAGRS